MSMLKETLHSLSQPLEAALAYLKEQLAALRTSRATPAIVENVMIETYGSKLPLKAVASISVPEPRVLLITPWDPTVIPAIEHALATQASGLAPVLDKTSIKLTVPALTEERRKELLKALHQRLEETRVKIRTIREETWKKIQALEKEKQISEDDKFRGKTELQKIIDHCQERLEQLGAEKEAEITRT